MEAGRRFAVMLGRGLVDSALVRQSQVAAIVLVVSCRRSPRWRMGVWSSWSAQHLRRHRPATEPEERRTRLGRRSATVRVQGDAGAEHGWDGVECVADVVRGGA